MLKCVSEKRRDVLPLRRAPGDWFVSPGTPLSFYISTSIIRQNNTISGGSTGNLTKIFYPVYISTVDIFKNKYFVWYKCNTICVYLGEDCLPKY